MLIGRHPSGVSCAYHPVHSEAQWPQGAVSLLRYLYIRIAMHRALAPLVDNLLMRDTCRSLTAPAIVRLCAIHTTSFKQAPHICFVVVLVMEVPICPPGPCSGLARHLRIHGWSWDEQLLMSIVGQLAAEDIRDSNDLRGVMLADIDGSDDWPPDVKEFIEKLCQVHFSKTCIPLND